MNMRKTKRAFAALVAAALLFAGAAALAEDTQININAGDMNEDGTITVTVSLSGGADVAGAQFALDYDENMLELVKVKNGAMTTGGISATNDEQPGRIIFIWSTLMDGKQPGELLKLTFRPKDGARGSTAIKLDDACTETMIIDNSLNELTYTESPAKLELAPAAQTANEPTASPAVTAPTDADIAMNVGQSTSIAGESGTIWSSSNERVATVDENGNVTAHAEGEAVIYGISGDSTDVTETVVAVGAFEGTGQTGAAQDAPVSQQPAAPVQTDGAAVSVVEAEKDAPPLWLWLLFAAAAIAGAAAIYFAIRAMRRR